jgi:hypothetical protein
VHTGALVEVTQVVPVEEQRVIFVTPELFVAQMVVLAFPDKATREAVAAATTSVSLVVLEAAEMAAEEMEVMARRLRASGQPVERAAQSPGFLVHPTQEEAAAEGSLAPR